MPTRVITGGVGVDPRRDHGRAAAVLPSSTCDDLRTLLMYEPRGHAAMSGAILQPPTRPDADYGVLYIEVSGCLPMCGHGTIGVATVLVETGMVPVVEPVTTVRLDTPAGLVVAEVAVEDGAAKAVTLAQRARPSAVGLDRKVEVPGFGDGHATTWPTAATSTPSADSTQLGLPFDRAARTRSSTPGWPSWTRSTPQDEPVHPRGPGHPRLPPRLPRRARLRRAGTRGTRWPSTPAGSTARPAAPAPAPGWPSCTPAASCPLDTRLRQRVVHRHPVHRPAASRRPTVGGLPAVVPDRHRPGLDHRHRPVLPRPRRPVPRRLPAVTSRRLPQPGRPLRRTRRASRPPARSRRPTPSSGPGPPSPAG